MAMKKTAGKRTARPGSRALDKKAVKKVKTTGKSIKSAGKKTTLTTGKNINAHVRARGKRSRFQK